MGAKAQMFTPKGMKRDYSDSKASPDFSYENHNIRITSRGDSTLLSITNERGPKSCPITGLTQLILTVNMEFNASENITTCTLSPYASVKIVADNPSTSSSVLLDFTNGDTVQVSGDIRNSTLRVEDSTYYDPSEQVIHVLDEFRTSSIIHGVCIGHCVLNSFVTLFCTTRKTLGTSGTDYIIRLEESDGEFNMKVLYQGDLNFSQDHPIETIGIYETEDIQKVYWLDGVNQSRVINIAGSDYYFQRSLLINTPFDFIGDLKLQEQVTVERVDNSNGSFRAGVIQYAFTYYNRNGQESNIFYVTPLQYISYTDRGGSSEDVIHCSFNLSIRNIDGFLYRSGEILRFTPTYDYLRVYAIYRSSLDATPEVRIVKDIDLNIRGVIGYGSLGCSCVDLGSGELIDPSILLYLGGDPISFYTFAHKDNTLFLGRYKLLRSEITEDIRTIIKNNINSFSPGFAYKDNIIYDPNESFFNIGKDQSQITTFKGGETYRMGVQFQHKTGKWSEVVFLKDIINTLYPRIEYDPDNLTWHLNLVRGLFFIPQTVREALINLGYRKARGVIVYPSEQDRSVIAQGILCPTVSNLSDRDSNTPYAQASWFFRPSIRNDSGVEIDSLFTNALHSWVEFRHNKFLPTNNTFRAEVQSNNSTNSDRKSQFVVNQSIVTLHSPDITFNEELWNLRQEGYKLRLVGRIRFIKSISYNSIQASGAYYTKEITQKDLPYGLAVINYTGEDLQPKSTVCAPSFYRNLHNFFSDNIPSDASLAGKPQPGTWEGGGPEEIHGEVNGLYSFVIYPWHRSNKLTSLPDSYSTTAARLENQIKSQYYLCDSYYESLKSYDLDDCQVFSSEDLSTLRLKLGTGTNSKSINYYGNINTTLTGLYDIETQVNLIQGSGAISAPSSDGAYQTVPYGDNQGWQGILMKYKTTPHGVLVLPHTMNPGNLESWILPSATDSNDGVGVVDNGFAYGYRQDNLNLGNINNTLYGYLWIGEIYKETVENRFGGDDETAITQNLWLPAGQSVSILTGDDQTGDTRVYLEVGDTYYQRYECMKTYSYDSDSINNMVEILSFPCESRINMSGRYDRNIGQNNNTAMSPTNFNLLNTVYSQQDNFFTYRALDYDRFYQDYFPNSVTWTKSKTIGELIDSWTSISLASTLDLDGDKGALTALRRLNNEIYSFQPRGISRIFFNSRTQLLTSGVGSGSVPVEIANSGKVDGKAYILTGAGSSNKWSILPTPSSIYFIDDLTSSLQMLTGQSIVDLSAKFAFRTWVEKVIDTEPWNPKDFNNVVSYYDPTNSDVYFVTNSGETTVCYSELLGQFSSFFNYDNIPAMFSINGRLFSFKDNLLWEHEAGDYNNFFGQIKPYSIEVIANLDAPIDKIYNTVEWRATIQEDGQDSTSTFDTVRVTTDGDYQDTGEVPILNKVNSPVGGILSKDSVSLRRKFRIWRIPIPRASSNKRDRIRGPWAHIKLAKNNPKKEKMELHDIVVHFFE